MKITCPQCHEEADLPTGAVNRARKQGVPIYCGRVCAGLARRKPPKTAEQKKAEKAEYDKWYRLVHLKKLKKQKAAHYRRTADREKERAYRQANMPRHVAYCQRPEYVEWKRKYDRKYRAAEYGEFAEAYLLAVDINKEVKERISRHEIYRAYPVFAHRSWMLMDAERAKTLARLAIRRGSPEGQPIHPCKCFRDNHSVARSECYAVCGDAETAVAMALRTAYALGQDAASVWQPIDTAPKDATKIDLWMQIHASPRSMGWADSFRVPEAWWQESTRQWVHLHEGKAQPLYTEYVTHWMPLPAAPRGGGYV